MSQEKEREAFEKQVVLDTEDSDADFRRNPDGTYVNYYLQLAWEGWQARAALASQQAGKGEPFGYVTVRRLSQRHPNHADQYQFYKSTPYVDNVDECHAVYLASHPSREVEPLTDEALGIAMTNSYYDAASFIAGVRFAETHHGTHSREGGSNG